MLVVLVRLIRGMQVALELAVVFTLAVAVELVVLVELKLVELVFHQALQAQP
jgi:hypothetical protein